jgi:hypothetical protein
MGGQSHKCLFCGTPQDIRIGAVFVRARRCGCAESRHHIENCDDGCIIADAEPGSCSYERFVALYEIDKARQGGQDAADQPCYVETGRQAIDPPD